MGYEPFRVRDSSGKRVFSEVIQADRGFFVGDAEVKLSRISNVYRPSYRTEPDMELTPHKAIASLISHCLLKIDEELFEELNGFLIGQRGCDIEKEIMMENNDFMRTANLYYANIQFCRFEIVSGLEKEIKNPSYRIIDPSSFVWRSYDGLASSFGVSDVIGPNSKAL